MAIIYIILKREDAVGQKIIPQSTAIVMIKTLKVSSVVRDGVRAKRLVTTSLEFIAIMETAFTIFKNSDVAKWRHDQVSHLYPLLLHFLSFDLKYFKFNKELTYHHKYHNHGADSPILLYFVRKLMIKIIKRKHYKKV